MRYPYYPLAGRDVGFGGTPGGGALMKSRNAAFRAQQRRMLSSRESMLTEIACEPISEAAVIEEIPFICFQFAGSGADAVNATFRVGCPADHDQLWSPFIVATPALPGRIAQGTRFPNQ